LLNLASSRLGESKFYFSSVLVAIFVVLSCSNNPFNSRAARLAVAIICSSSS
jgi:hypothetical protein